VRRRRGAARQAEGKRENGRAAAHPTQGRRSHDSAGTRTALATALRWRLRRLGWFGAPPGWGLGRWHRHHRAAPGEHVSGMAHPGLPPACAPARPAPRSGGAELLGGVREDRVALKPQHDRTHQRGRPIRLLRDDGGRRRPGRAATSRPSRLDGPLSSASRAGRSRTCGRRPCRSPGSPAAPGPAGSRWR
jgi:hypothetical protein